MGGQSVTIFYCIPTYKSFDHCKDAVIRAQQSSVPVETIVIDNSPQKGAIEYLKDVDVELWELGRNIGVAGAWNLFLSEINKDYIIIANDDVFVHPNTVEELVRAADTMEDEVFFCGNGASGNSFSLYLLKQKGFKSVGTFDEQFYPGYFEDNDYSWRLRLLGYNLVHVPTVTYDHVGSSTLKRYTKQETEQHHQSFRRNREYYRAKWGGGPNEERWQVPFNGV